MTTVFPSSNAERSLYAVPCLAKGVRRPATIATRSGLGAALPLVCFLAIGVLSSGPWGGPCALHAWGGAGARAARERWLKRIWRT